MSLPELEKLTADVQRLLAAGGAAAAGDEALHRRAAALRETARTVPAVLPIAEAALRLSTARKGETGEALLDLLMMMQQVRAALADTEQDGELTPADLAGPWRTHLAPSLLSALALKIPGGGDPPTRPGSEEWTDLRLLDSFLNALQRPDGSNFAEEVLWGFGPVLVPELRRRLDLQGKMGDRRLLRVLCRIDPALGVEVCRQAIREGSESLRQEAMMLLPDLLPLDEVFPVLRDALADRVRVSKIARESLERLGRPTVKHLLSSVAHEHKGVRAAAAMLLGKLAPRTARVVRAMRTALADSSTDVRLAAAGALQRAGRAAVCAADDLATAVRAGPSTVRVKAIDALVAAGNTTPAVTDALKQVLRSDRDAEREKAVQAMVALRLPADVVVPTLCEALEESPGIVSQRIVDALKSFGTAARPAAPVLQRALSASDDNTKIEAILALEVIGVPSAEAVEVAADLVKRSNSYEVRRRAIETLGRRGPSAAVTFDTLHMTLKGDWPISMDTADAFERMGAAVVPNLKKALGDKNSWVRVHAARSLGRIGPVAAPAVPALLRVVKALKPAQLVEAAIPALARIGPAASSALRTLRALGRKTTSPHSADAAIACARIAGDMDRTVELLAERIRTPAVMSRWFYSGGFLELGPRSAELVAALRAYLNKDSDLERYTAIGALGQIGEHAVAAVPDLVKRLKDRFWRVRKIAATTLGRIGPSAARAGPALTRALEDGDLGVRDAASQALMHIRGGGADTSAAPC